MSTDKDSFPVISPSASGGCLILLRWPSPNPKTVKNLNLCSKCAKQLLLSIDSVAPVFHLRTQQHKDGDHTRGAQRMVGQLWWWMISHLLDRQIKPIKPMQLRAVNAWRNPHKCMPPIGCNVTDIVAPIAQNRSRVQIHLAISIEESTSLLLDRYGSYILLKKGWSNCVGIWTTA